MRADRRLALALSSASCQALALSGRRRNPQERPECARPCFALAALLCGAARADEPGKAYWGSPSVDGGKCCATLAEVRDNIDRIDRDIVRLMASAANMSARRDGSRKTRPR